MVDAGEGAELIPEERQHALLRLAEVHSATGEHLEAGERLEQAYALFPRADRAPLVQLYAALERWSAGAVEGATTALKAIREATHEAEGDEGRYVHRATSEVLNALDRDGEVARKGPRWRLLEQRLPPSIVEDECPGRSALKLALTALERPSDPLDDARLPTMAHLRHALEEAGLALIRLTLDESRIESALEQQALVILEEERSTETGFLLLMGYDPVARLLMLRDPRRLALTIRGVEDQWRRSALHGRGALLVGGDLEQLARVGLCADEHLDLVDHCDLDAEGNVPTQARVASLAVQAIAIAPDLPMPHKRHGESLVGQLRLGNIEPAPSGPFERWLATTRLRFPNAEWPFQIYAEALELQGRYEEAGIAWSDAMSWDPYDERNFIGQARVLAQQGRLGQADQMLRRASTLKSDDVETHVRRADLALADGRLEEADLLSEIAGEIDPDAVGVLMTRASVSERRDRLDEAMGLLQRVIRADPQHSFARVRLLRCHAHRGAWQEAENLAAEVYTLIPGVPRAWETAAWVAWATGDGERALSLTMTGLQRCGVDTELIHRAVGVIASLLAEADVEQAVTGLAELLSATPSTLLDAASSFSEHGWYPEAIHLAELARQLLPNDPNTTWRLVQILLSSTQLRRTEGEQIERLLEQTIEGTRGYPFPRIILAWRRLQQGEPTAALELLEGADVTMAPAPIWYLQARALEALERGDEASQVRARMPELFPDGVLEPVGLLRFVGLTDLCSDLLDLLLADLPDHVDARLELARTRGRLGAYPDQLSMFQEIDSKEVEGGRAVPLPWLLDAADEAGDWDLVERTSRALIAEVEQDSTSGFDAWRARAQLAGARLAQGDPGERLRLLERAPSHPDALAALVSIERRLGDPATADDEQRLQRVAPGTARSLEEKERHS
jgi:tetratricopeptide (TPR) repeat protein